MKLISLNIERNKHHQEVLEFVRKEQPDVFCVQELLDEDYEFYKKELGIESAFIADRRERNPKYTDVIGKKMGVAIFAKNIIDSGSIFYMGEENDVLKPFDNVNYNLSYALVWADIKNTDGEIYKFATIHMPLTLPPGDPTPYQLEAVDSLLEKLSPLEEIVLCGDTNAPRGKETFSRLARKYKDNIPEEYTTSLDQNLHRVKGLERMVDGLFTTPTYLATEVKLVDGISDHMAIVAEINKI